MEIFKVKRICPKCGTSGLSKKYNRLFFIEWLIYKCNVCGYKFKTKTKGSK